MAMLMSEIYDRRASEKRRLRHFLGLAIDLNTAETNVLQGEEARPVVATMEGLADQLATAGPEPLSVVDDTKDQMFDLKAQESTLQDELLGRNRDLEAQEAEEKDQNRSLGGRAGASLEFQKSHLLRRIKVHNKFMVDLLGFMDKKKAVVGRAVLRLEAALATCDARDKVISAADERMAKYILELIDRAQNKEPAAASVEAPANSVTTALNKWVEGSFFERFVARTMVRNNVDATFMATRALSPVDTWYVLSTCLGQGTFGGVFKIDVPTLGESFAMKLIKEGEGENARRRTRRSQESLLGEMVICVCVPPHPNVLQAVGVDDRELGCMKIVYHLAEGDFSRCAWGSTEDSAGTKMRYLSEAAMGLTHLANHGYVHNDIKPANILLVDSTQDGNKTTRAVLADFGCALAIGDERLGEGTLGSRPPEARSSELITRCDRRCLDNIDDDRRFDKYIEIISHRNMLESSTLEVLLNPDHLLDELHDVKQEFIDIVRAALQRDPTLRPSPAELVESLTSMSIRLLEKELGITPVSAAATAAAAATTNAIAVAPAPPQMAPSLAKVLSGEGGGDGGGLFVSGGGGSGGGNAMLPLSMQPTGGDAAAVGRAGAGGSAATPLPKDSAGGATAAAVAAEGRAGVLPSSNNVPRYFPAFSGEVRAGDERVPRAIQVGGQCMPSPFDRHRGPGGGGFENLQSAERGVEDGNAARVGGYAQAPPRCHHPQRQGCAPRAAAAPRHRRHNRHHQHRGGNEEAVVGIGVKPDGRRAAAAGRKGHTGRRPQHDTPRKDMNSAVGGTGASVPSPPCVRPPPGYEQVNAPGHAQHSAPGYAQYNAPGYAHCSTPGYPQYNAPGYGQYNAPCYGQYNGPCYAQCSTPSAVPPPPPPQWGAGGPVGVPPFFNRATASPVPSAPSPPPLWQQPAYGAPVSVGIGHVGLGVGASACYGHAAYARVGAGQGVGGAWGHSPASAQMPNARVSARHAGGWAGYSYGHGYGGYGATPQPPCLVWVPFS
ncbi:unnamed protein product [Ectocarpus sp. 8 AP-2014]